MTHRIALIIVSAIALFHWGASIAVIVRPCHIPWLHFSLIATVLTVALITQTKGSDR